MSTVNKTALGEAKISFEEIRSYATEAAKKELQEQIDGKISEILNKSMENEVTESSVEKINEDININISDEGAITIKNDGAVTNVSGSIPDNVEVEEPIFGFGDEGSPAPVSDEEEFKVDAPEDEEEFEVETDEENEQPETEENMTDMEFIKEENPMPAPDAGVEAAAAPVAETPVIANPFEEILKALASIDAKLSSGAPSQEAPAAEAPVEIVDDASAAAPVPVDQNAPMEEEIELEPFDQESSEEEAVMEIMDELGKEGEVEEVMEIVDENPEEECAMEEDSQMRRHRAGQREKSRKGVDLGQHAPVAQAAIKESKENTAQNESKTDELNKENESLKETIVSLNETIDKYKESFVELRKQFDEMQTFNAKLAFATKIFANGGLTTDEKKQISEEFDKVGSAADAKKLFERITKDKKLEVGKEDISSKIKAPTTNNVKSSTTQPLYESVEVKRNKELAGIIKENN